VPTLPPKRKSAAGKVATSIVVAIVVISVIILLAPALSNFIIQQKDNPAITILQPSSQQPRTVPREELVQYVLDRVNKDRTDMGLHPVRGCFQNQTNISLDDKWGKALHDLHPI
jgi:hypothetical protein